MYLVSCSSATTAFIKVSLGQRAMDGQEFRLSLVGADEELGARQGAHFAWRFVVCIAWSEAEGLFEEVELDILSSSCLGNTHMESVATDRCMDPGGPQCATHLR